MSSQHISVDHCLDYLIGEIPDGEKASLEGHLGVCPDCQLRVDQYKEIMSAGLPSIASGAIDDMGDRVLPWSLEDGQRKIYAALRKEADLATENDQIVPTLHSPSRQMPKRWLAASVFRLNLRVASIVAGSLVLAVSLGTFIYKLGLKDGLQQTRITLQPPENSGALRAQLDELVRQRESIHASLIQRETLISELRAQFKEQQKQNALLEASFRSASHEAQEETQRISLQRDDLARKLEDQKAVLTTTQNRLDALQQAGTNDALRMVSLENQIQRMSQLFKDKDAKIDEQQRMLAADRDIRDLMGARDLYIAEVYDVGGNGKRKKPYGRVFYTKGKSLIFYAYDLDQQLGLKNASTFQAWGLRGPDRNTALSLGVMYADNSINKRWVLRFDDPQALEEINAVFVTIEPNGGSRVPRGQQVLFAYLKEEPNHP